MARASTSPRRAAPKLKRKNMLIDQHALDAAKAALGATTETATVNAALDLVVFRSEVFVALDQLAEMHAFGTVRKGRRAG
jgi:hypothetical protein